MNTSNINLILLLLLLLLCPIKAYATDKKIKLYELARYERVGEVIQRFKNLCKEKITKINPDSIVIENPDYFGGITPDSIYWDEVKSIYKEYILASCSYLDEEQVLNEYVNIYSQKLSEESLDAILTFYQSEAGRKYRNEIAVCNERMQKYYSDTARPAFETAMKMYSTKMNKLIIEFRENL